jgi:hypothetical protein
MGETCRRGKTESYKILFRKPELKIQLRRHICKWADNIKARLREIGTKMWARLMLYIEKNIYIFSSCSGSEFTSFIKS